ncbi:MAG: type II toxin-antitoxin system RelE/ParE family toxin [Proteobacteria bacterium]|nr:type II toxin-antitoxin system RelE/ParE family toxin [Pseudomonadota bacterium]
MARFRIEIKKSAIKELETIPSIDLKKVMKRIESLAEDPRPHGSKKLSGEEKYRIRQGNYRILYLIEDDLLIVYVVKVAHRKNVYR